MKKFKTKSLKRIKFLLENFYYKRFEITYNDYVSYAKLLNITPNLYNQRRDCFKLKQEIYIKNVCKILKISKQKLIKRLKLYNKISQIDNDNVCYLRKILNINTDRSKIMLNNRSSEEKRIEKQIIYLWNEKHYTYRQISEKIGHTFGATIQKIHRLRKRGFNLKLRPPGNFKRQTGYNPNNILKRIKNGESIVHIAKSFNKKPKSFYSLLALWRIKYKFFKY